MVTMKFLTLAVVLAISCVLPIFAYKEGNDTDMAGSSCENEHGQCIDEKESQKCLFPLAMLKCPHGKECCIPFPNGTDDKLNKIGNKSDEETHNITGVLWGTHDLMNRWATNWGYWGPAVFCASGSFAYAFEIKVESDQGWGDDTAMNGIKLHCSTSAHSAVTSTVQKWGHWKGKRTCSNGYFTGMNMRSEGNQGGGDDTAANDLAMNCNWSHETHYGGGMGWGHWNYWAYCGDGSAICGLMTLVEPEGYGDDTALNNVIMWCCSI